MTTTWRATRHNIDPTASDFHAAMGHWQSPGFTGEQDAVNALVEHMEAEARAMLERGSVERGMQLVRLSVLVAVGRMDIDTKRQPGRRYLDMGVVRWSIVYTTTR